MRPSAKLAIILIIFFIGASFYHQSATKQTFSRQQEKLLTTISAGLGLTDLCVATEARYTRHPAISDPMAPFMDHPGSIEHFPTGSFWAPVNHRQPGD